MPRPVARGPPGFLAHLIGGTWCLLCVAGQVGQPERLQPSSTSSPPLVSSILPSPLASAGAGVSLLWGALLFAKLCSEAQ